jgi:tyrosyl-tRNA synthetase
MLFGKKTAVSNNTNTEAIHNILTRAVENIYPNKAYLEKRLTEGKPISLYLGIDPTGPTLHIGHAINLMKLKKLQQMGHKVILLIGDFTGMIGDPTDKTATRKQLTKEEVLSNAKLYKSQAETFLNFSGPNKAELRYNSEWLSKLTFAEVIELLSHVTVDQMLKRDMFDKRVQEGKPIHLHEFLYPVMQGYDSVAMNVDGEIGGNDQTFNMLAGRGLMKDLLHKEKFVITMKLLADQTGKKMGKTEGNILALTDSPGEMFGKVMSWTDGMIVNGFELCTDVPMTEIEKIKKDLESGANPKDIKMRLAKEIVAIYHGEKAAEKAEENFVNTFQKGSVPEHIEIINTTSGKMLVDVLLEKEIVSSKTDWRRLVTEGAVTDLETEEKISDQFMKLEKNLTLKIGKKRFVKIVLE